MENFAYFYEDSQHNFMYTVSIPLHLLLSKHRRNEHATDPHK